MNEAIQVIAPFAFAGIAGYIAGYAFKKFLKIVIKMSAFVLGFFFLGLFAMQYMGYVSAVNWDKIGEDIYGFTYDTVNSTFRVDDGTTGLDDPVASAVNNMVQRIGYQAVGGFGGGFMLGFARTK